MTIPTNFYTQSPSLLPQGLQSLISSGQASTTQPQNPYQSFAMTGHIQPNQIPTNWNQMAQSPIYQGSYAPPAMPQMPQMPITNQPPLSLGGQQAGFSVMPAYGTFSRALVR